MPHATCAADEGMIIIDVLGKERSTKVWRVNTSPDKSVSRGCQLAANTTAFQHIASKYAIIHVNNRLLNHFAVA